MCICVRVAGGRLKPPNPPACYRHMHLHSVIARASLTLIQLIEVVAVAATMAATTFKLKKKHAISDSFIQKQRLSLKKLKVN